MNQTRHLRPQSRTVSNEHVRWLAALWLVTESPSDINLTRLRTAEAAYTVRHATENRHHLRSDLIANLAK